MELNVLNRLQNFKLRDEENEEVCLCSSDIHASKEERSRSLIGKIYGEKVGNYAGLRNTLFLLWSAIGPVKIREMGITIYQFVFAS